MCHRAQVLGIPPASDDVLQACGSPLIELPSARLLNSMAPHPSVICCRNSVASSSIKSQATSRATIIAWAVSGQWHRKRCVSRTCLIRLHRIWTYHLACYNFLSLEHHEDICASEHRCHLHSASFFIYPCRSILAVIRDFGCHIGCQCCLTTAPRRPLQDLF